MAKRFWDVPTRLENPGLEGLKIFSKRSNGRRWGQSPEVISQGCHLILRLQNWYLLLRRPLHPALELLGCSPGSYRPGCSPWRWDSSASAPSPHSTPTRVPQHTQVHKLAHLPEGRVL